MTRFEQAIQQIDLANSQDPNKEIWQGKEYPKELLYSERMTHWLEQLAPNAPETLRLAARGQHLCRWMIPRKNYPANRAGYFKWRTTLYEFHAQKVEDILKKAGYDLQEIQKARDLICKKEIKSNPEMQTLEDVICLVFLENYFADFSKQHEEEKVLSIVNKIWKKMSVRGQEVARQLKMSPEILRTIEKGLIG